MRRAGNAASMIEVDVLFVEQVGSETPNGLFFLTDIGNFQ
jgi:hypothetical protein